jgi:NADPH2:quinone reductase
MRASILNRVGEPLKLEEVALPIPRDGEVLIAVYVAGMNFAESQKQKGRYFNMPTLPAVLGLEAAGVVIETGANVSADWKGKRVVALLAGVGEQGGYAEYAVSRADELLLLPDNVSFEESLAIPIQGLSAYFMLHQLARVQSDDTIFIHAAAGGVGTIAIQLAKKMGIKKVIAGASSDEKLALAKSLGADVLINYAKPGWASQLIEATFGKGPDIILSAATGDVATESLRVLAPFGRFIVYGFVLSTEWNARHIAGILARTQSINGFFVGSFTGIPGEFKRAGGLLLDLIANDELQVVIGSQLGLDEAQLALDQMEKRQTMGKSVLRTSHYQKQQIYI